MVRGTGGIKAVFSEEGALCKFIDEVGAVHNDRCIGDDVAGGITFSIVVAAQCDV